MNKEGKNLFIAIFITSIFYLIICLGNLYTINGDDFTTKIINSVSYNNDTWFNNKFWWTWHFVACFIFTFIAPSYWYIILLLGILWELFEQSLEIYTHNMYTTSIIYHSPYDYLFNTLGVIAGFLLNKALY
jgi:hypothetical protein